jgi:hypothetical protein
MENFGKVNGLKTGEFAVFITDNGSAVHFRPGSRQREHRTTCITVPTTSAVIGAKPYFKRSRASPLKEEAMCNKFSSVDNRSPRQQQVRNQYFHCVLSLLLSSVSRNGIRLNSANSYIFLFASTAFTLSISRF